MTVVALSTLHTEQCPDCGADLATYQTEQDAMFLHGGYGASRRTVQIVCPDCGWAMVREVSETRPPRGAA